MDAGTVVEHEVRELVRRRGLDPAADPTAMRQLVDDVIADYDDRSLSGTLPALADAPQVARQVYDAIAGFGPLQQHLDDPTVEEIWINAPGRVFVARRGRSELTTTILAVDEVRDVVERMLKASGRRVDLSTPFVDAMLPDGSRLHVVIPDITRRDWAVNPAQSFSYYSGAWGGCRYVSPLAALRDGGRDQFAAGNRRDPLALALTPWIRLEGPANDAVPTDPGIPMLANASAGLRGFSHL